MKALISKIEPRQGGYRVAHVESDDSIFDVADTLFWVDCSDEVKADYYWYDPVDETIKIIPPVVLNQPSSSGSQNL